jgi:hypothetical protein
MVRMAPAQGFAWVGWVVHMYMHKCNVGFSDPKFRAGACSYHLMGVLSKPIFCVHYESAVVW